MTERTPNNIRSKKDHLRNTVFNENYRISNRNIGEIDHFFRGFLSTSIGYLSRQTKERVLILDLGGGPTSQAARDIAVGFPPNVFTVNVDSLAKPVFPTNNVSAVNADIFHLPFRDNTFHLAFSRQLLASMERKSRPERTRTVIEETIRVLREGGVGIIDESHFSHYPMSAPEIQTLNRELDITIEAREGGLFEHSIKSAISRGKAGKYRTRKFLIIFKHPVDTSLKETLAKIPFEAPRDKIFNNPKE